MNLTELSPTELNKMTKADIIAILKDVTNGGGTDITQMRKVLKGFERGKPAEPKKR